MDELQALTAWGERGYAVYLTYGLTANKHGHIVIGWSCVIGAKTVGSVTIGLFAESASGYHPTDPIEAARECLVRAREMHEEERI